MERLTEKNRDLRRVLDRSAPMHLVRMALRPGGGIGFKVHARPWPDRPLARRRPHHAPVKVSLGPTRCSRSDWPNPAKAKTARVVGIFAALAYMMVMENTPKTAVLYNADCPVCNFEIRHYARYSGENGLPIRFDDLNTEACAQWGLDADTAARRLYVFHDGELTSGVPAFLVLWAQMPRYRLLAKLVGLPGVRHVATLAYDYVLAPAIYRWHLLRLRRRRATAQD